ncbi:hypothetical protein CANCADRAFT_58088 [Tortispora caseinolytica NRRL Y-17796]|uniref:Uncharacterized protein n=1 Tax=Tortispora caseinolytica NRRL Y-17796 TaxID=767744 RepID=A0A1E4TBC2_9ASCO|nr:hypothetical protein CANCADRAFT_58088 [Tortispora caseinolytica NRRL Y-17796]
MFLIPKVVPLPSQEFHNAIIAKRNISHKLELSNYSSSLFAFLVVLLVFVEQQSGSGNAHIYLCLIQNQTDA